MREAQSSLRVIAVCSPRLTAGALFLSFLLATVCSNLSAATAFSADEERAQTVVHLLDYISVDYPAFVRGGQVLNPSEFAEQREFAGQALTLLQQLPSTSGKADLLEEARSLQMQVEAKAEGAAVVKVAAKLRADLIDAYALTVAPLVAPLPGAGAHLFETHCSMCHGAEGRG